MPITDQSSAEDRLTSDTKPLTEAELHDLVRFARVLSNSARESLQVELSLLQLATLKRQEFLVTRQIQSFATFDKSTAKANSWMLAFTAAVTFMTLVQLGIALYPLLRH